MSEDDSAIELEEQTRPFIKSPQAEGSTRVSKKKYTKHINSNESEPTVKSSAPLLGRFPSFQSALRPNFGRFRNSFRKLSCTRKNEEDMEPMMEVPRHKSVDIGVGLARRVSLFLFTRRTVCVHPYHPYTPAQTTRKLHLCFEDKYVGKHKNKRKP